ncbi:MAG: LuxR C-terminal-related transcriptional regulator [Erythrobacter sp.]|uniref:LuxR C-terminal-related transcriptional regulator n=1 Tax=Erythrobacter sp. TaxID=1042 RepID=UPI0032679686
MVDQLTPDEAQIAQLTPARSRVILDSLTDRQTEVMRELVCYRERKEIARDLKISYTRITQHLDSVKEKFTIANLSALKIAYLIASYQCDRPVFKEKQLRGTSVSIHQLVSTGRYSELHDLYVDPDFKQFIRDRRSSGWRALDAWFGPGWRPIAIVLIALTAITMVAGMFFMSDWITARFETEPSSPTMETRSMNNTKPQQLSDGFHSIEDALRNLELMIAQQLSLANEVARENGIPTIDSARTFKHLSKAAQKCGELSKSAALSHMAAQKLAKERADIIWRCPNKENAQATLSVVA